VENPTQEERLWEAILLGWNLGMWRAYNPARLVYGWQYYDTVDTPPLDYSPVGKDLDGREVNGPVKRIGFKHSEATKQQLSKSHMGKKHFGIKPSAESKAKMSASHKALPKKINTCPHPEKPHVANGMCRACYSKNRRKKS
jgi:hypothetical protein